MLHPEGFVLGKCLVANERGQTYLALRKSDRREVVLRTIGTSSALDGAELLRREHEALRAVAGPGIVQALEFIDDADEPVLVLERVPGNSLANWRAGGPIAVPAFLDVAIQLSEALARVHAARWIHCELTPKHAVVEPGTQRTWLIGFQLAQTLGAHTRPAKEAAATGSLAYMAPEQTGRMNRGVDARSDLYSLGATLYFALTGKPPFEAVDPLALIHAHMARIPRPPTELRREIPDALSRLVLKLLEKEPEARYQSAQALLADLRICREQWSARGEIDDSLVLDTAHVPDRPRFSGKLFGRDDELERLRVLYRRACAGAPRILMIAGEPGAGKSALADELRPDIARSSGYLAVGKFDLSRDHPYGAWATALGHLAQQLLVESNARLAEWRSKLCTALGGVARALVDLVPDLQFVLGDVPAMPKLGARETRARLALALKRFINAFATREHPLVLFLDDLQWSDAGSRELLEELLAQRSELPLLVIGAYRASELAPDAPLAQLLERLEERQLAVEVMTLRPLSREATVDMLADALEKPPEDVVGLAELLERKTGNAPLFVRQFVEHLHQQGLLRYELDSGWTWAPDAVASAPIPDGAVALMTAKLRGLDAEPRTVIELASCVSDEFDAEQLTECSTLERATVDRGLYALCNEGLIAPSANGFRFVHDRIRETARQLMSDEERARLHERAAELLLERIPLEEQSTRIFEIAEHLNAGIAHWPEEERLAAVRINLSAARHALMLGAPDTAETFLSGGRALFREEDWPAELALGFDLHVSSMETAFLLRDYPRALELGDVMERQPISDLQLSAVIARRIQVLSSSRAPEEATRYTLEQLRRFGLRWPLTPSHLRIVLTLRYVVWTLRGTRVQRALRLTQGADVQRISRVLLLGAGGAVMSRTHVRLACMAAAWTVASNERHGYLGGPSYALGAFASYLQLLTGNASEAERLENAASEWQARNPDPWFNARNDVTTHGISRPWRMARRRALAPLDQVADRLHELGDLEYSFYARFLKTVYLALGGEPIAKTSHRFRELADAVRQSSHFYAEPELCLAPYSVLESHGAAERALEERLAASEAEMAAQTPGAEPFARTVWLMVLCVHGRWDLALAQADALGERLFQLVPFVHVVDHTFYRGLAAAGLATHARGATRRRLRRDLARCLRRLRRWAKVGPDFVHMVSALEAEQARLAGKDRRARALYEKAARRAKQQEFPHHAALAHERLARMHAEHNRRGETTSGFQQAIALYAEWGMAAKVHALEAELQAMGSRGRDAAI